MTDTNQATYPVVHIVLRRVSDPQEQTYVDRVESVTVDGKSVTPMCDDVEAMIDTDPVTGIPNVTINTKTYVRTDTIYTSYVHD